jgi:hypothetical protein
VGKFEYYIDYDKDGYYYLAEKQKNKKEKVIAMGQSPSQLLSHAYIQLGLKSVVYVSDVINFIIDSEQEKMINDLNDQLLENFNKFFNNLLDDKKNKSDKNTNNGE